MFASRIRRVALLCAGAGCVAAVWAAIPPAPVAANPTFAIKLHDNRITPKNFSVKKGDLVELEVTNQGSKQHNLVIPAFYIFTQNLQPGANVRASFRPDKTGSFPYYSDTGGKPEPGMAGTMTVSK